MKMNDRRRKWTCGICGSFNESSLDDVEKYIRNLHARLGLLRGCAAKVSLKKRRLSIGVMYYRNSLVRQNTSLITQNLWC